MARAGTQAPASTAGHCCWTSSPRGATRPSAQRGFAQRDSAPLPAQFGPTRVFLHREVLEPGGDPAASAPTGVARAPTPTRLLAQRGFCPGGDPAFRPTRPSNAGPCPNATFCWWPTPSNATSQRRSRGPQRGRVRQRDSAQRAFPWPTPLQSRQRQAVGGATRTCTLADVVLAGASGLLTRRCLLLRRGCDRAAGQRGGGPRWMCERTSCLFLWPACVRLGEVLAIFLIFLMPHHPSERLTLSSR